MAILNRYLYNFCIALIGNKCYMYQY